MHASQLQLRACVDHMLEPTVQAAQQALCYIMHGD